MRKTIFPLLCSLIALSTFGQVKIASDFTISSMKIGSTTKLQVTEQYGNNYTIVSDSSDRHAAVHTQQELIGKSFKVKIGDTFKYAELGMEFFFGSKYGELRIITLRTSSGATTTTGIKVGVSKVSDVIGVYGNLTNPPRRITDPHWNIDENTLTLFYDGIRFVVSKNLVNKPETEIMDEVIDTILLVKKNKQK